MSSNPAIPAPGVQIGDYEVVRELGRGGMATILEGVHVDTGEHRAIKLMLLGHHTEEVVARFNLEFEILSKLKHPGVLKVFECGVHESRPFIVMEIIEGQELASAVESWKELKPQDRFEHAERVLSQVATTLEYVHTQGLVHRDVTPSNIMLLDDGSSRLMDFGVVKEPGVDLTTVGEVVGTVAYIAPEQINGDRVDARTDLYSLGAVLYLMLTGRRPFTARTMAGYLDKHLNRPVKPPRELVPTVPRKLNDICTRLLAKSPDDRFGSASHLLHVIDERSARDGDSLLQSWHPGVVGRAAEIAQVREAVARLKAGTGGVLVLEAAYGMGRTALARESLEQAKRLGIETGIGRNARPDQQTFSGYRELLSELAPGDLPPVLEAAFGGAAPEDTPIEKWSVFTAFKTLFADAGPRLVVLDDLDQADRGTIEMTEYLVRNLVGEENFPLLFVITRAPTMVVDPLVDLLDGHATEVTPEWIRIGPLGTGAVEELLLGLIEDGPKVRTLAKRLQKEGEGNPYFIGEMIRGLLEEGLVAAGGAGERGQITISETEILQSSLPVPSSIRDAILERISPLSSDARHLMAVLGLARQEMSLALLCTASAFDEGRVLRILEELIDANLIRERNVGETEGFELSQNRLKDVLVEETQLDVRQRIHRRIGEAMERAHRHRVVYMVESLAYHFEQGGVAAKAYPYLVRSAEKLLQRTFVEEALSYLDRAQAIEMDAREYMTLEDADRRLADLLLKRTRALYHLGRWKEAAVAVQEAGKLARLVGDLRLLAGVETEIGSQARRIRDLDRAETHLSQAAQYAREHGDRRMEIVPLYELGGVSWGRGDLDAARDWWVEGLARSESFNDEPRLAMGYGALGLLALCKGQSAEARRKLEQAIEVCEKHGLMERLTVSRINLVELYHFTGNFRKGLNLADQTVLQAREVHHRFGVALGLRYRTIMLTDIGRFSEAMENATASLRIHEEMDNKEEQLSSLVVAIRTGLAQGAYAEVEPLLDACEVFLKDYDTEGFAPVIYAWRARSLAIQGRMNEACDAVETAASMATRAWPGQRVRTNLNMARAYHLLDAPAEAMKLAEEGLRIADASGYRHYAMRARRLIMDITDDEAVISRHQRVAEALARSLAANLEREDADAFLRMHGVAPRVSLI